MTIKEKTNALKLEFRAMYLAMRDPRTPWYAKVLAALVAGYALSPIDLIPDFIPVIGLLDDLIIVPLGIWIVFKLIPKNVLEDARKTAAEKRSEELPASRRAAYIIVGIWIVLFAAAVVIAILLL